MKNRFFLPALILLLSFSIGKPAHADIASGLVGYWNFDAGSGTAAADSSGSNNTGTLTNGPAWTAGKIGSGALSFSGTASVAAPASASLSPALVTVSAWVNLDISKAGYIAFKDKNSGTSYQLDNGVVNSGYLEFCSYVNGAYACAKASNSSYSNAWTHIVGVYDGTNRYLYINGALQATAAGGAIDYTGPASFFIGGYSVSGYTVSGSIDDVRVYSRALSSSDVSELYAYAGGSSGGTVTPPPSDPTPPASDTTAPVISSVASGSLTSSSAAVSWSTNESADSQVEYGLTTGYGNSTSLDASQVTFHSVSLSSLSANTLYHYRVKSKDASGNLATGNDNTFTTSAAVTPPVSSGPNIYISQSGTGDGSSCSSAKPVSFFNSSSNWGTGSSQIGPGDTVHLCGTISSTLTVQGSGSSGNPITILFENGAKMSLQPWVTATGINVSNRNWITIDGGTNGLIEALDNGSSAAQDGTGPSFGHQLDVLGIDGESVTHLTIQNLKVDNMYQRKSNSTTDANRVGQGFVLSGSNILVRNNTLTDGDTMIGVLWGPGAGVYHDLTITGNTIGRANHGIGIGSYQNGNSYFDNVTISNNRINDLDVWNGNGALHLDGIIIYDESQDNSGGISNLNIFNNYIGPNIGTINTAAVFIIAYTPSEAPSTKIYNNLFTAGPGYSWTNGFIAASGKIYSNTFIGQSSGIKMGGGQAQSPGDIRNNLFYNDGPSGCTTVTTAEAASVTSDYNVYACAGQLQNVIVSTGGAYGFYYGLPAWKAATGYDAHTLLVTDPQFVNAAGGDYRLLSTSPAVNAGANLSSSGFSTDKDGNARPSSGAWDIGAYEYNGSAVTPPVTPPPSSGTCGTAWYIDNSVASSGDGCSWGTAWKNLSSIAWGSVKPGDTIYISGGASSQTYNETLAIGASGSAAGRISVRAGQDAGHNGLVIIDEQYARDSGIVIGGKSYINISGQVGSGSSQQIRVAHAKLAGIDLSGASTNIDIGYLDIASNGNAADTHGISATLNYNSNYQIDIHNNAVHDNYQDGMNILQSTAGEASQYGAFKIHDNDIYNVSDDGIEIAVGADIYNNTIHGRKVGANGHPDGIQFYNSYTRIYGNTIYDLVLSSDPGNSNSSIFFDPFDPDITLNPKNIQIYDNVIKETAVPGSGDVHRGISLKFSEPGIVGANNILLANNVITGTPFFGLSLTFLSSISSANVSNIVIENNVFKDAVRSGIGSAVLLLDKGNGSVTYGSQGSGSDVVLDYNSMYASSGTFKTDIQYGGTTVSYASFKQSCGCQAHDVSADPALDSAYAPGGSSPLVNAGASLASYFTADKNGVARPQGSAWDIGAYEYTGSVTPPPASDTTAPSVSIASPSNGGTISGSVSLSASASDNVGVAGVQFKLDGASLGTELTNAPYSGIWNTVGVSDGSHALTAVARDAAGNTKTSNSVTVTVSNSTADTSAPSTPTGITSASVTQTGVTLSWLASVDNVGVSGYKLFRNGTLIASPLTNTYAVSGLTANTLYTFTVSAYDAAGNNSSLSLPLSITTASIPVVTYPISASKSGTGLGSISGAGISCGSTCSALVTIGTTVTLTAVPNTDSTFDGWSGACTNSSGTCTTTVTSAKSVSAIFTLISVTTPVTPPASGGGGRGGSSSGGTISSGGGSSVPAPSTGTFTPTVPQAPITSIPVKGTGITLTKNLYRGITDLEVTTLQKYLIAQGYLGGTATGYFGPLTEAGVMRYQAAHGITQTGTIGPITRASLAGGSTIVPVTTTTSGSIPAFTRSLTIGSTGTDVKYLQIFLNKHGFQVSLSGAGSPNNETSYFGPATARALGKFQAAKGISPSVGYFGPLTMKAVNSIK